MRFVICVLSLLAVAQAFSPFNGFPKISQNYVQKHRATSLRMAESSQISMPALSSTMTEGKIVQWAKSVGDKVEVGDVVMVVESDKADMDCEAYEDGYIAAILVEEGEVAPVGAPVALLAASESEIGEVAAQGASAPAAAAPAPEPVEAAAPAPAPVAAAAPAATLDVEYGEISMPALSSTMTEGKVVQWAKAIGDKVEIGDTVMVVESDKADMDCEAYEEGYLAAILCEEGDVASVGSTIAVLAKSEADIPKIQAHDFSGGAPAAAAPVAAVPAPAAAAPAAPVAATPAAAAPAGGRVVASGYAKKLAEQLGIDLALVAGTGPGGRIVASDVENFKASGATAAAAPAAATAPAAPATSSWTPTPGVINATPGAKKLAASKKVDLATIKGTGNFGRVTTEDIELALGIKKPTPVKAPAPAAPAEKAAAPGAAAPASAAPTGLVKMTGMEKAVSVNMEATLDVPVFSVSRPICTDKFDELYQQLKPKGVSVTALLTVAVARALEKHPLINAVYQAPDGIKYNEDINVANAVAIEGGLITPVIKKANTLDLYELARQWKVLVGKAKSKSLSADEYSTGTLTITNLGMMGVTHFSPIIPPNHGAILAIGASTPVVKALPNGHFGVKKEMMVTLTADHRIIYGAHGAAFLADLADILENDTHSLTM
mmetsp:Transcript_20918/g.27504  ORF Transcript_20918/g.27504 Transcript_20918/m.27504 type:complete len:662 (-) Transcript_20918:469-2454(-)